VWEAREQGHATTPLNEVFALALSAPVARSWTCYPMGKQTRMPSTAPPSLTATYDHPHLEPLRVAQHVLAQTAARPNAFAYWRLADAAAADHVRRTHASAAAAVNTALASRDGPGPIAGPLRDAVQLLAVVGAAMTDRPLAKLPPNPAPALGGLSARTVASRLREQIRLPSPVPPDQLFAPEHSECIVAFIQAINQIENAFAAAKDRLPLDDPAAPVTMAPRYSPITPPLTPDLPWASMPAVAPTAVSPHGWRRTACEPPSTTTTTRAGSCPARTRVPPAPSRWSA
jgi:hypothetical protein